MSLKRFPLKNYWGILKQEFLQAIYAFWLPTNSVNCEQEPKAEVITSYENNWKLQINSYSTGGQHFQHKQYQSQKHEALKLWLFVLI